MPISHIENKCLFCDNHDMKLENLRYVSQLEENLVSIKKLCEDNVVSVDFIPNTSCEKDLKTMTIILMGPTKDDLYQFPSFRRSPVI